MLEYWYKEKRTLVDFRRGPLGPHFDGFAAYLKAKGYSRVLLLRHFVPHVLVEPGKGQECITRVLFAEELRGIHEVRAIVEQS
ncbi:MAG: hypothetical protein ACLQU3_13695 [Limisphaerales bacterium]